MLDYKKYTVFGLAAIKRPTPAWVKRALSVVLLLMGVFSNWCYATSFIPEHLKPEILLATGTITAAIAAVAPLFGVKVKAVNR